MKALSLFAEQAPEFGDGLDFYETPAWATEAILPFLPPGERWALLEPAAGRGALIDVAVKHIDLAVVWAVEFHQGRAKELEGKYPLPLVCSVHADFLTQCGFIIRSWQDHEARKLILMNPPYTQPRKTIGLEFVEKALEVASPDGVVAALLPLDFATGTARCERVHDRHKCSVYPLRRRPHFGGPHSGMRPFAWFVWNLRDPKQNWSVIG